MTINTYLLDGVLIAAETMEQAVALAMELSASSRWPMGEGDGEIELVELPKEIAGHVSAALCQVSLPRAMLVTKHDIGCSLRVII